MITASVGVITIVPVVPVRDAALLHSWVTHPRSVFWGMQDASPDQVRAEYTAMGDDPHHDAFLGLVDDVPQFLTERYDPAHRELAGVPEIQPGDVGMHVLVAPTDRPVPGFTAAVMRAVLQMCFRPEEVRRVVVEPDVRNTKIAALNAAAGFRVLREVDLGHKTAALSAVTREQFTSSTIGGAL